MSRVVGCIRRTPAGTWRVQLSRTFPTRQAAQRAALAGDEALRGGQTEPTGDPVTAIAETLVSVAKSGGSVADVLTGALGEAAERLGSVCALVDRPGSWEAAHIVRLAGGSW